ncbi:MAG: tetratricopeptide repeat protein [Terriglobia bacterium]
MKPRRSEAWVVAIVLALVLAPATAWAQASLYGSVTGKVTKDGEPVKDAVVILRAKGGKNKCEVKTDKNGEYFCRVRSGDYTITLRVGDREIGSQNVKVFSGFMGDPSNPRFRNGFDFPLVTGAPSEEDKAAQEAQDQAKAGFARAVALNRGEKYEEALTELAPVLEKDPEQWVVHAQMGVAYAGLKRNDEAESAYQKAIELNPTHAGLHNNLGQVYIAMGRTEDAIKEYEAAAELSPEDAATYFYNLGVIFYNKGDMKAAQVPFRKAVESDPTRAEAYYLLGTCLLNTAQYKQEAGELKMIVAPGTRESFERYLALEPNGRFASEAKAALQAIDAIIPAAMRVNKKKK